MSVDLDKPDATFVPARALHARLLQNAAQRRMRGQERRRSNRREDADYWLAAAPMAIRKASALRAGSAFAALP